MTSTIWNWGVYYTAAAKAAKDGATSDRIRDDLKALGIQIKDTKDSTEWTLD